MCSPREPTCTKGDAATTPADTSIKIRPFVPRCSRYPRNLVVRNSLPLSSRRYCYTAPAPASTALAHMLHKLQPRAGGKTILQPCVDTSIGEPTNDCP